MIARVLFPFMLIVELSNIINSFRIEQELQGVCPSDPIHLLSFLVSKRKCSSIPDHSEAKSVACFCCLCQTPECRTWLVISSCCPRVTIESSCTWFTADLEQAEFFLLFSFSCKSCQRSFFSNDRIRCYLSVQLPHRHPCLQHHSSWPSFPSYPVQQS